jgi:hypothetical protein
MVDHVDTRNGDAPGAALNDIEEAYVTKSPAKLAAGELRLVASNGAII